MTKKAPAKSDPLYYRRVKLAKRYNMTHEEYEEMLRQQGGVCAICGGRPKERLSIDHNHADGYVRSLLCHRCNMGLAALENPRFLASARLYLQRHHDKSIREARELVRLVLAAGGVVSAKEWTARARKLLGIK